MSFAALVGRCGGDGDVGGSWGGVSGAERVEVVGKMGCATCNCTRKIGKREKSSSEDINTVRLPLFVTSPLLLCNLISSELTGTTTK